MIYEKSPNGNDPGGGRAHFRRVKRANGVISF